MKTIGRFFILMSVLALSSCAGAHNNNEDHAHYIDSVGMNEGTNEGSPNTSTAPIRDTYPTDTINSTVGPDNATPKSSAMDSTGRH